MSTMVPEVASRTEERLVFLHIPKCAGTSFHHLLTEKYPAGDVCPERLRFLDRIPDDSIGNYRLYSGHYFIDQIERIPEPKSVVTWLREPRKRLLSLYYFFRSYPWSDIEKCERLGVDSPRLAKELDLLSYLRVPDVATKRYVCNGLTQHLIGLKYVGADGELLISAQEAFQIAIRNLQKMAAWGVIERYSEARPRFEEVLSFPLPEQLPVLNRFESLVGDNGYDQVDRLDRFDLQTEAELSKNLNIDDRVYEWAVAHLNR